MASTPAAIAPPPPPLNYRHCNNVDGLVSVEALRIIVEIKACFVVVALAVAYILTASRHRLWSSSHLIKGFLFAVTQPVTRFLVSMFAMLLSMPFRNDLYLLWGILLLAGYEGVYTISGYGVSTRLSDLAVHEFARFSNIVLLELYVQYYSHASQFRYPLWALWVLMVAKFLERIVRFKIANGRYGEGSTSRVADYMKHEHELTPELSSTDIEAGKRGFTMKNYNYLIVGDSKSNSKLKEERIPSNEYDVKWMPGSDTVTVAKVWECQGELLARGDKLKDVCLSFALCKLLRRKFAGVDASTSERDKAQELVFDGLIPNAERTFRVVRAELGFARDMSFTKYPILFSCGFPVVSALLFAATLGVSLWIMVSAILHYRLPRGSTPNFIDGKNVDLFITFVIVVMVTVMDICEFSMHLFSNWTKVMIISEYVRKPHLQQYCLLDRIMRFVCHGKIAEPIGSSLGQFDLVNGAKKGCTPRRIVKLYHNVRSFVLVNHDDEYRIRKGKTLGPVPVEAKEAICQALMRNRTELTQGLRLLTRSNLQMCKDLCQYCELAEIETVVVWHVATCKLEQRSRQEHIDSYRVATVLSKYCAYLVFYKPKLLPAGNTSVRHTCKTLVADAIRGGGDRGDGCMIKKGEVLAELLLKRTRDNSSSEPVMWAELADFWSELVISLAPFGSVRAHEKEIGDGGEFITHIWALLHHAGIDDKFSWSSASPSTAGGGSGGGADNSTFQNGMGIESHTVTN